MALSKEGLKIFLLVINVILFLCGGAILGVGSWAVADKIYLSDIVGNSLFASASYLMVICGCVLVIISFVGCAGAITGKRLLLLAYPITLSILLVLLLSAAICAAVFQSDVEDGLQELMRTTIREKYGFNTEFNDENARVTESWDTLQSSLECCAVDDRGWFIYRESRWFQNQWTLQVKKFVPASCCIFNREMGRFQNNDQCQSFTYGPPGVLDPRSPVNNYLYYDGCYAEARKYVVRLSTVFLALGFTFVVFLVAGIVVSLLFYRRGNTYSADSADVTTKDRFNDKRNLRDSERRGYHERDHREMDERDHRDYRDADDKPDRRVGGRRSRRRDDRMSEDSDEKRFDDRSDREYRDYHDDYRNDDNYEDYDDEPKKVRLPYDDRPSSYKHSAI